MSRRLVGFEFPPEFRSFSCFRKGFSTPKHNFCFVAIDKNSSLLPQLDIDTTKTTMTWHSKMIDAMDDESLLDVNLIGTDNVRVRANKNALAIHSAVLKELFFGGSQGDQIDSVNFEYPSNILKTLVEYCYTGNVGLFGEDFKLTG